MGGYKNELKDWCLINSKPYFFFLLDFYLFSDSMKWPHYQKYVNQIIVNIKISLKLNFINIQSLHSNSPGCTSFLESNFLEILVLCETFSTRSSNFSLQGYLPLIWKDSMTHMHRLAAFWRSKFKNGLIFRKLWGFLFMFSTGFTSSHFCFLSLS